MRKTYSTALVLVFLVGGAVSVANAQPKRDKAAEQKAMMDAMMKAGTPGDNHKKLDGMTGTWDANVKMWMEPGKPPTESAGKAVNEWVLGGRWLQQKFEGSMMGMPFSGIGYTGYDNIRKSYVGTWMDSMSTSAMTSTGTGGDAKTWNFTATSLDPQSGEPVNCEEKITWVDKDKHVFEMSCPDMDGNMSKMMEITYTRKK
jgi:hypothetical protein